MASARDTYRRLGAGEYRQGRTLDALLAAYRVGARLAWRRFVDAGTQAGFPADALYDLGEAMFAYIDEISAESAAGFAEAQSEAAGESQRRRRRLLQLLVQEPAADAEAIRTAAQAAGWALPRLLSAVVAGEADQPEGPRRGTRRRRAERGTGGRDRGPARAAPRAGRGGRGGRRAGGRDDARPRRAGPAQGARGRAERRTGRARAGGGVAGGGRQPAPRRGRVPARRRKASSCRRPGPAPAASGGARGAGAGRTPGRGAERRRRPGRRGRGEPPAAAGRGARRARPGGGGRSAGQAGASPRGQSSSSAGGQSRARLIVADEHLPALLLAAAPGIAADLVRTRLAPLDGLAEGPRERLVATLRAWLDRPGQVQAIAAALDVHPQTVRYRLKQLRELYGERLEDPDARFELSLALRAADGVRY